MDPNQTEELFEAFTQESEGVGREYEGSGLGLAVVRETVEETNGAIDVETETEPLRRRGLAGQQNNPVSAAENGAERC